MGIEYILDCDCALRQEYGLDGMTEMFKHKNRVDTLYDIIKQTEPDKDINEVTYVHEKQTGGQTVRVTENLGEMKKKTDAFTEKLKVCSDCPCNLVLRHGETHEGMGCYRAISYPIDAIAENILVRAGRWIVANPGKMPYADLFIKFIEEKKITGKSIENLRKSNAPHPFFELKNAPGFSYGKMFRKSKINTNQMWAVLTTPRIPHSYSPMLFEFLEAFALVMNDESNFRSSNTTLELLILDQLMKKAVMNKVDVLVHV